MPTECHHPLTKRPRRPGAERRLTRQWARRGIGPADDRAAAALLDEFVTRMCDRGVFSGAVAVARGGAVIYERACGLASRAFGAPNRVDTKFNLGSMNKMFTAVSIAELVAAEFTD